MKPVRIAAVDDNVFLLNALKEKLSFFEDLDLVFTALDGEEFLRKLAKKSDIDLILMDIEMPVMDGIIATKETKRKHPHIKVIMLTVFDDYDNIFKAIREGANGYLLKEINAEELHQAIVETMEGGAAMTPVIAKKAMELLRNPRIQEASGKDMEEINLTKREVEILQFISNGLSYTEIAAHVNRAPKTIRNHLQNIYKKLHVHSKLEAIEKARNNRIIE